MSGKRISVRDAIAGILSKTMTTEQAYQAVEDRADFEVSLAYVREKNKLSKAAIEPLSKPPVSEAQRKAMWAAAKGHSNIGIPASVGKDFSESDQGGKLPEHKSVAKSDDEQELVKFSQHGQWSLNKVASGGVVLNYNSMNKPKKPQGEYAKYKYSPTSDPVRTAGDHEAGFKVPKEKMSSVKNPAFQTHLAEQRKEYGVTKNEGINLDANPTNEEKNKMTAKNDMAGYGMGSAGAQAMQMSEAEPHKDDPTHEKKEKEEAKRIKKQAQKLLDMHKK